MLRSEQRGNLKHRTAIQTSRLRHLLSEASRRAQRLSRPILVSLTEPVDDPDFEPLTVYTRMGWHFAQRVLWLEPASGFALVGAGSTLAFVSSGPDRFQLVDDDWRGMLSDALIEGPSDPAIGPRLLGGFRFDPEREAESCWSGFPTAIMQLPRIMLTQSQGSRWLTQNRTVGPTDDVNELAEILERDRESLFVIEHPAYPDYWEVPSPRPREMREFQSDRAHYEQIVAEGAAAVRQGALEKVVLARHARLDSGEAFDIDAALERLAESYPTCTIFAFGHDSKTFLGATPERLVELRDGVVRVDCLAGTQPRGETPEEDERLAQELLASGKNRWEHDVVLRAIRQALDGLCDEVHYPAEPGLRTVRNVHHLHTPVVARPAKGVSLLDLVGALHPTPAVGGTPREAALAYIREHEGWDRGWYAGPIGWLDARGNGAFSVALRSALVDYPTSWLFAGCGIVGESDPESEFLESAAKLRPVLGALGISRAITDPSEARR